MTKHYMPIKLINFNWCRFHSDPEDGAVIGDCCSEKKKNIGLDCFTTISLDIKLQRCL